GESMFADLKKKGRLDSYEAAFRLGPEGPKKEEWDEQANKIGDLIYSYSQLSWFIDGKSGVDYAYYPGRKLGEKDRIVFWHKDKQSGEYTAVYGDLRAEKIDKDKLPPPPVPDSKE